MELCKKIVHTTLQTLMISTSKVSQLCAGVRAASALPPQMSWLSLGQQSCNVSMGLCPSFLFQSEKTRAGWVAEGASCWENLMESKFWLISAVLHVSLWFSSQRIHAVSPIALAKEKNLENEQKQMAYFCSLWARVTSSKTHQEGNDAAACVWKQSIKTCKFGLSK